MYLDLGQSFKAGRNKPCEVGRRGRGSEDDDPLPGHIAVATQVIREWERSTVYHSSVEVDAMAELKPEPTRN